MNYQNSVLPVLASCLILFGCSDDSSNSSTTNQKDHVWKEQTDTINRAKEVEGMMLESAEATRKLIEEQGE